MKLNFLCAHHQNWLEQNPSAALPTCVKSYETGLDLVEEGNFTMAASHAGCALDAAQILMRSDDNYRSEHLVLYCDVAELLVRVLLKLQEVKLALGIYDGVLMFLERLLVRGIVRDEVLPLSNQWLNLREEVGLSPLFEFNAVFAEKPVLHH